MNAFLDSILTLGPGIIYLVLFLSAFVENIFPPVPSDVIIIFGAYLAGRGKVDASSIVISAVLGGFLGFMAVYYIAFTKGRSFFSGRRHFIFSEKNMRRAERWFRKYGDKTILFSRFLPGVRSVVSPLAGVGGMAPRRIALYAFVGIALWDGLLIFVGLLTGSNWELAVSLLRGYNKVVLAGVVSVLCFVLIAVYWKRGKRRLES